MIYTDGLVSLFAFGGIYAAGTFGLAYDQIGIPSHHSGHRPELWRLARRQARRPSGGQQVITAACWCCCCDQRDSLVDKDSSSS